MWFLDHKTTLAPLPVVNSQKSAADCVAESADSGNRSLLHGTIERVTASLQWCQHAQVFKPAAASASPTRPADLTIPLMLFVLMMHSIDQYTDLKCRGSRSSLGWKLATSLQPVCWDTVHSTFYKQTRHSARSLNSCQLVFLHYKVASDHFIMIADTREYACRCSKKLHSTMKCSCTHFAIVTMQLRVYTCVHVCFRLDWFAAVCIL